jgi:hypothetical protein
MISKFDAKQIEKILKVVARDGYNVIVIVEVTDTGSTIKIEKKLSPADLAKIQRIVAKGGG